MLHKKGGVALEYYVVSGVIILYLFTAFIFSLLGQAEMVNYQDNSPDGSINDDFTKINFFTGLKTFIKGITVDAGVFGTLLWTMLFISPMGVIIAMMSLNFARGRG